MGTPRIKPGAAGREARMLPLCYAAPPPQIVYQRHPQKLSGFQKAPEPSDKKVWVVLGSAIFKFGL